MSEIPDWVINYFDFAKYGQDIAYDVEGEFTSTGWLEIT